jgi:nucleotidyltransferase substrate binding protein (TIGR01987 family)
MDLVFKKKRKDCKKALKTLEKAVELSHENNFYRDSMVIRFLYTNELFWKMLKAYIYQEKQINCSYATDVFRELRSMKFISAQETELFLKANQDRNFCAHAYQEEVIAKISLNIPKYAELMRDVLDRL